MVGDARTVKTSADPCTQALVEKLNSFTETIMLQNLNAAHIISFKK